MSIMNRFLDLWRGMNPLRGKPGPADPDIEGERARKLYGAGQPVLQSAEEQEGVRSRMVAELEAQREHRAQANQPQSSTAAPISSGWVGPVARTD